MLIGEQVKKILDESLSWQDVTHELNKLLENEPTNEAILSLYNALDKRIDAVFLINKQAHEYLTEVMKQMNRSWSEDVKGLTDKLDKIQEQLDNNNESYHQLNVFGIEYAKYVDNQLRNIQEQLDKIESPQKETQEKSCVTCKHSKIKAMCSTCMRMDEVGFGLHSCWQPKETPQEKSCVTCKNYEYCYNTNGPICDSKNCKLIHNHWQPKQESR